MNAWIILTFVLATAVLLALPLIERLRKERAMATAQSASDAASEDGAMAASWASAPIGILVALIAAALGFIGLAFAYLSWGTQDAPRLGAEAVLRAFAKAPETFGAAGTGLAVNADGGSAGGQPVASVEVMIARLEARLQRTPGDAEGWRMLGWSYFHTDHFEKAAEAYAKAVELRPGEAALHAALGESRVRAQNGTVSGEAKAAFTQAISLDAKEPRARFFLGLAKQQEGQKLEALKDWLALLEDVKSDEELAGELKQRVSALGEELGASLPAEISARLAALSATPAVNK